MKLSTLLISALFSTLLFLSGCVGQPEPAGPVVTDKSLPQVSLNGYLSDTDAVAFEWKPLTDPRVKGVRIYRDTPGSKDTKLYRIATVDSTLRTHYLDNGLTPGTTYRYRFTTFDAQGHESLPDRTITAKTLPLPGPVSFFTATHPLARSVKLIWRPHPDLRVSGYEIQRLDPGEKTFHTVDEIEGRLNAEYIDRDLEDNSLYRYRIVALTFDGRKTAPSTIVTVSTKPLPLPPKNLKASHGGIHAITVTWEPSPSKDIAYYKVYRARSADSAFGFIAKTDQTRYTDKIDENGARYFYLVTAVDKDGLESLKSESADGQTLAAPKPPQLLGATRTDNAVVIRWKPTDPRTAEYILLKTTKSGWLDSTEARYNHLKTTQFTDPNIVPGREYVYSVIAVDKNGLASEPSEEKSVITEAK